MNALLASPKILRLKLEKRISDFCKCTTFDCVGGVKASLALALRCIISNCIVTYQRTCNSTNVNKPADSQSRPLKLTFQQPSVGEPLADIVVGVVAMVTKSVQAS